MTRSREAGTKEPASSCAPVPFPPTDAPGATAGPPPTPRRPVTHTYHGVEVQDDYQWLERRDDPEVIAWTAAQTAFAQEVLDAIPGIDRLRARVAAIKSAPSADYLALARSADTLFALEADRAQRQQPRLVRMASDADPARAQVVVDPNELDPSGATTIDFFAPSPDGSLVAVSLSRSGTERGDLHIFESATGKPTGDIIERVNNGTAGGSAAWDATGEGIFYTRYPAPGERSPEDLGFYQQLYHHRLGSRCEQDSYVAGHDFPRIAEIRLHRKHDGTAMLVEVADGDGGARAFFLRRASGELVQIARFGDEVAQVDFGPGDRLFVLTHQQAPRGRILAVSSTAPELGAAVELVSEGPLAIREIVATRTHLHVVVVRGGPSEIHTYDHAGLLLGPVPTADISSVQQLVGDGFSDELLFRSQSFIVPPAWYRLRDGVAEQTPLRVSVPVSFDDAEVVREQCRSADGTLVPINIIRRKGAVLDGTMAGVLTGYGGYGVSLSPRFRIEARLWLDAGGFLAVANLRGGSEFGEGWHRDGQLARKQNVFDDMAACASHLVERGYTQPARLGATGGSNGGLLMGAMVTQHPSRFGAVVSYVGIYDMLRVELTPNGAFNVTEYGSVKVPEQLRALYAYSPYHRVAEGAVAPPVLLITGENDPRVDAWHSKKMAARLQAANPSHRVLLYVRPDAGHGIGRSSQQEVDDTVLELAFLFHSLGVAPSALPASSAP